MADAPNVAIDVTDHIGFARYFAARFLPRNGVERDDLEAAAILGLMKAIPKYDPAKGKFTTYAAWWAKKEIQTALADGEELGVPEKEILADIGNEYNGRPRDPDVFNARFRVDRLERPVGTDPASGKDVTVADIVAADHYTPVSEDDCEGAACLALDRLTAREPLVGAIVADYVLGRRSMKATAAAFGLSTGRTKKLVETGLAELRKELAGPNYEQENQP